MSWNNVVFLTLQSLLTPQPSSSRTCSLSECPLMLAMILAASSQEVSCGDRSDSSFIDASTGRHVDASDGRHCDIGRMWGSEKLPSCVLHSISVVLSGFLLTSLKSALAPESAGSTFRRSSCALSCNVLIGGSVRSSSGWLWIGGGRVRDRKWVSTGGVGACTGEAIDLGGSNTLLGTSTSDPDKKAFTSTSETPFCASSCRSLRLSSWTFRAVCWISLVTSTPFLSYSWIRLLRSSTNSLCRARERRWLSRTCSAEGTLLFYEMISAGPERSRAVSVNTALAFFDMTRLIPPVNFFKQARDWNSSQLRLVANANALAAQRHVQGLGFDWLLGGRANNAIDSWFRGYAE
jgi:hypothetical protein